MRRLLSLLPLALLATACARTPSGGTLAGDVYEIRLAIENLQARQDALGAEMRAFRASQDRQIETLSTRLTEIEATLRQLREDLGAGQVTPEPRVRHELRLPPDRETLSRPGETAPQAPPDPKPPRSLDQ